MKDKTYEPASISLTQHGVTYRVDGLPWDIGGIELQQEFRGLMHAAGFSINKFSEQDEWTQSK